MIEYELWTHSLQVPLLCFQDQSNSLVPSPTIFDWVNSSKKLKPPCSCSFLSLFSFLALRETGYLKVLYVSWLTREETVCCCCQKDMGNCVPAYKNKDSEAMNLSSPQIQSANKENFVRREHSIAELGSRPQSHPPSMETSFRDLSMFLFFLSWFIYLSSFFGFFMFELRIVWCKISDIVFFFAFKFSSFMWTVMLNISKICRLVWRSLCLFYVHIYIHVFMKMTISEICVQFMVWFPMIISNFDTSRK